ncbi:MAG: GNAT family N-acetyltransferase [Lachnospiraceae bacterium]|nr:GNAT family N-acetyltransferase [Lachnospiraceae bacterium]
MRIQLKRATLKDADLIWHMQVDAFADMLAWYQDFDTSPGNEPFDKVIMRLNQSFTYFYLIYAEEQVVGAIRVVDKKEPGKNKRISPIFVKKEYRGLGIAQQAIAEAERIHGSEDWELDTILQEKGNCYLYEKMGYKATGKTEEINQRLTLVFYEK